MIFLMWENYGCSPLKSVKTNQYKTTKNRNELIEENYDKMSQSGTYEGRGEWGRL
jgi:hypothetical protein